MKFNSIIISTSYQILHIQYFLHKSKSRNVININRFTLFFSHSVTRIITRKKVTKYKGDYKINS
jgi:hypothetical protein